MGRAGREGGGCWVVLEKAGGTGVEGWEFRRKEEISVLLGVGGYDIGAATG